MSVQAAGETAQRVAAGRYSATGAHGAVELLVQSLRISAAEARRRIGLAQNLLPARDLITGELAPAAAQPVLGDAFFKGQLSVEQAAMISKFVAETSGLLKDDRIDAETCHDVEETLVETGREEGPDFLRHAGNRIMSLLDPDGQKPTPGDLLAKQGLFFRKPRRGLIHFDGHMTIEQYENLMVAIGTATNPNKHKDINDTNPSHISPTENPVAGTSSSNGSAGNGSGDTSGTDSGTGRHGNCEHSQKSSVDSSEDSLERSPDISSSGDTASSVVRADPGADADSGVGQEAQVQGDLFDQLNGIFGLFGQAAAPASNSPNSPNSPPTPDGPEEQEAPAIQEAPEAPEAPNTWGAPKPRGGPGISGQPWRRALEPWEVPPCPSNAPPDAVAPIYEGDTWFWFAQPATATQGWAVREESNAPFMATLEPETKQTDDTGASAGGLFSNSGLFSRTGLFGNSGPLIDQDPGGYAEGVAGGMGTGCAEGIGSGAGGAREARVVEGVRIPVPGSGEILDGLDSNDPDSTDPVTKDTRTYGQKLLDGLLDCVKLAARTDNLPLNGGLKTQLLITVSQADLDRHDGTGTAFTTYTGPVPLALFEQSLCDPEITRIGMGHGQEILSLGRTQRLFTPAQRKVLLARDLGCSFPNCTVPAPWTEAHHVVPWQEGGETNLENAALLCSHHHTTIHHSDWTVEMIDGTPSFTAPYFIDPSQTPRRNRYHRCLTKKL
ncbi:hypothetical protein AS189_08050 [Arthrobacter alpinus]|uniref:HNH nuclease domain-containing protein n=1 Tax=Arthrobacter alpinus TaxID=656366 RepID=A0A0S2LYV5_9MICC|nr:hypothetical protein AS189_08050 [Arthrobacter alpinus]